MMDLRNHLQEIAGPRPAAAEDQIAADIVRGRSALRRRRTGLAAGTSALAVAVAAAVITAGAGVGGTEPGPAGVDRPATAAAAQLVAYQGEQPKGFTIDKVPDGWFIVTDDTYSLLMAPQWAKSAPPGIDPSQAPVYDPQMTTGKIAISLESKDNAGPGANGTEVKVGDTTGVLVKEGPPMIPGKVLPADGDYGGRVWVRQQSGAHLTVSFPEGLNLGNAQMAELAAGVHVRKEAEIAAG